MPRLPSCEERVPLSDVWERLRVARLPRVASCEECRCNTTPRKANEMNLSKLFILT